MGGGWEGRPWRTRCPCHMRSEATILAVPCRGSPTLTCTDARNLASALHPNFRGLNPPTHAGRRRWTTRTEAQRSRDCKSGGGRGGGCTTCCRCLRWWSACASLCGTCTAPPRLCDASLPDWPKVFQPRPRCSFTQRCPSTSSSLSTRRRTALHPAAGGTRASRDLSAEARPARKCPAALAVVPV